MNPFDELIRKERRKIEEKRRRRIEKQPDPDIIEAQKLVDSEFPGAEYDDSIREFIEKKKHTKLFKKFIAVFLVKFIMFAGFVFWLTAGSFSRSILDYATIALGGVIFAVIPVKEFARSLVSQK
jgi:hypothetical protein